MVFEYAERKRVRTEYQYIEPILYPYIGLYIGLSECSLNDCKSTYCPLFEHFHFYVRPRPQLLLSTVLYNDNDITTPQRQAHYYRVSRSLARIISRICDDDHDVLFHPSFKLFVVVVYYYRGFIPIVLFPTGIQQ